ncbi:MAG: hypothetical protein ABJN69_04730 [Hellea sp.]
MQVQELNDLADWFKKNVLNFHESKEDADDIFLEITPHYSNQADAAAIDMTDVIQAKWDEELSLLEFIIGIDST